MTLTLVPIDHGELCHGWAWTIDDEDVLAERVARIVLGQYRHVAKILSGAGVPGPAANAEQANAALKQLTLAEGEDPWHRDGWLFQAISWIAAHQQPSASLTRMPHIRKADKGFDGMQLELNEAGTSVTSVVVFEDKATDKARDTIRDDVWPGIVALEKGERRVAARKHYDAIRQHIQPGSPHESFEDTLERIRNADIIADFDDLDDLDGDG